jgi:sugar lactone lactonase YvrE
VRREKKRAGAQHEKKRAKERHEIRSAIPRHEGGGMDFTRLTDHICILGEGPVWDDRRQMLFFVDIPAPAVHAVRLDGSDFRTWQMPNIVGSIGLTESGRLIVALKHDLVLFDPDADTLESFTGLPGDEPAENRLNDGKVGPDGAFWVGTMHDVPDRQPIGALYRVAPDGTVTRHVRELRVSNGLAWSPDGRIMYHADTRSRWLDRWDFDPATGAIGNRTRIVTFDGSIGLPDGGATDAEGIYWVTGNYGSRLLCYNSAGELVAWHPFPVPAPTMTCFCGPDLRTLAVTTHRSGAVIKQLDRYPESGGVFIARAPVAGSPVARMPI